eukprot:Hpha_TRINITY_DN15142_c1_g2::TRINITY_DN15142_c1_g2_i1::g.129808::m.129808/K16600/TTLL2; tubulin polyglutamylase TTLL2
MPTLRADAERPMPPIVRQVLLRERGWRELDEHRADEQAAWNLWWRSSRFSASQVALSRYPQQRLNHFPKTDEITKKDTLLRNIRRMRGIYGGVYNILPVSFALPGDQAKFSEAWKVMKAKSPGTCWICKPSELSRGRKIYVFRELSELRYDCPVVVQQYIERPLLYSGYKFDLRVYVMVTSYQPLRVYVHRGYMVRFSTQKYDLSDLSNLCAHLTNTSLNKKTAAATSAKDGIGVGCKWEGSRFTSYLAAAGIDMNVVWKRIDNVIILTLLSIASQVPQAPCCFELYGFDLLLDESFRPWLLEVNFSPALQIDGPVDERVKGDLVRDMLDVLNIVDDAPIQRRSGRSARSFSAVREPPPPVEPPVASGASQTRPPQTPPDYLMSRCSTAPQQPPDGRRHQTPVVPRASRQMATVSPQRPRGSLVSSTSSRGRSYGSSGTQWVDKPSGGFERVFPFGDHEHDTGTFMREDILREAVSEVRRREQRARQESKNFGRLHAAHDAQLRAAAAPTPAAGSPQSSSPPKSPIARLIAPLFGSADPPAPDTSQRRRRKLDLRRFSPAVPVVASAASLSSSISSLPPPSLRELRSVRH